MRPNLWKPLALALALALGVIIGRGSVNTAKAEGQAHMQNALWLLADAKSSLNAAIADKGGHRIKAVELCEAAMRETQEGIAAGAR